MCIFLKKGCKNRLPYWLPAAGGSAPDSRVVTLAYYYNLVEFVSSAKCVLLP